MKNTKKPIIKRSVGIIAAIIAVFALTATVFSAWRLLTPSEVAEKFNEHNLGEEFMSENAININKSVTSGGYTFTLLGIVSGEDIKEHHFVEDYRSSMIECRTYAVFAIQNSDGKPLTDDDHHKINFFASPYVKGLKPWLVNSATLSGSHIGTVIDGIIYKIIDCDNIAMFADRGLYYGIYEGYLYSSDAISYNAETGEIFANPDFDGAIAFFDLPIDKSLADPEKAEKYLRELLPLEYAESEESKKSETVETTTVITEKPEETTEPVIVFEEDQTEFDREESSADWGNLSLEEQSEFIQSVDWDNAAEIESTRKELTVDSNGMINYSGTYNGRDFSISHLFEGTDGMFADTKSPQSKGAGVFAGGENSEGKIIIFGARISIDADGKITGVIVVPEY